MRRIVKYLCATIAGTMLLIVPLQGQDRQAGEPRDSIPVNEQVHCFADRSLYITGESILFRACIRADGAPGTQSRSGVLYAELTDGLGNRMAGGKFTIEQGLVSGHLAVPSELHTGRYFLRCYTRWMRNWGPESFSYTPVKIVNPDLPELQPGYEAGNQETGWNAVSFRKGGLLFHAHPASYDRGDTVKLHLTLKGKGPGEELNGCLSVVPSDAAPADYAPRWSGSPEEYPEDWRPAFNPEMGGPELSGTISVSSGNQVPAPGKWIHITLLNEQTGYYVIRSDKEGKFGLEFPGRNGELQLFVQTGPDAGPESTVRINQDFDARKTILPPYPFVLNSGERNRADLMARNRKLSEIYSAGFNTIGIQEQPEPLPFYGSPTLRVELDNYVLLPTMEEVFSNLVPGVFPVKRGNGTVLLIKSENPSISFFRPLLMIDQVPVFEANQLLQVPTERVAAIDVITDVYVKGDQRFGGIINLRTIASDMAGISLPSNSFFIEFLNPEPPFSIADHVALPGDRLPDTRNTLLWIPDMTVSQDTLSSLNVVTSQYPGEFEVIFRGSDNAGNLYFASTRFRVR